MAYVNVSHRREHLHIRTEGGRAPIDLSAGKRLAGRLRPKRDSSVGAVAPTATVRIGRSGPMTTEATGPSERMCSVAIRPCDHAFRDGVVHIDAARMLHRQMGFERFDFAVKSGERVLALPIGELRPDPVLDPAELFDLSHGLMHRPQLSFEVGE